MKILILYSARSGTNSIAAYFMKQNPDYVYYNQPWSTYNAEPGMVYIPYEKSIEPERLLIKSEFSMLKGIKTEQAEILKTFDKVVLISRRNKREQVISNIIANTNQSYLDKEKKSYWVDGIDETDIKNLETFFIEKENEMLKWAETGVKLFYYEDLFYGEGFGDLFSFLNLKHIQEDYDMILDTKNRYKAGESKTKISKTLI